MEIIESDFPLFGHCDEIKKAFVIVENSTRFPSPSKRYWLSELRMDDGGTCIIE